MFESGDANESELWVDAGMVTTQADWSLDFDIGMNFHEWHAPVPLTRCWCLWEIFCSIDTGASLEVALGPRERAALYHQALDVFVVPRKDRAVTRVVTPLKPVEALANPAPGPDCECPHCSPNLIPLGNLEEK